MLSRSNGIQFVIILHPSSVYCMRIFSTILLFVSLIGIQCLGKSFTPMSISMSDSQLVNFSDSIIHRQIEEIKVYPQKVVHVNSNQYERMVRKIRKVYPFAKEAALELQLYNEKFKEIQNTKLKKQYLRKVEKELLAKHENDMKQLTISEGRYLMLLIDRETGETSYELVKELKGSLSAIFWQGIAKVFSNDLKEEYDPVYKHYVIEQIVLMIEKEKS
jgi:hypothetical protein